MRLGVAIIGFMTVFLSLANAQVDSSKKCTVDSYAAVFLENGDIYTNLEITDGKFVSFEDSWQKCYQFATQKASSLPVELDLTVKSFFSSESQRTAGLVYFVWKFNDGIILKSKGMINYNTKKFIKEPQKGDLRLLSSGARFE